MRNLLEFFKTTIIGGFLVLLPVVAVLVLIGIAVNSVVSIIAPVAAKLPMKTIGGYAAVTLLAVLLIPGFLFPGRPAGATAPGATAPDLAGKPAAPAPARLHHDQESNPTGGRSGGNGIRAGPDRSLRFRGQGHRADRRELDDGRLTVFVPISPTSTLGQIYILPADKVIKLNARFLDVVNTLTQWGVESKKVFSALPAVDKKTEI